MTCPKCHGDMRNYERSGVTIDQCSECRGIFLDRGELEKLFEAEANWNRQQAGAAQPQPGQAPAPPPPPPGGGYAAPPPPPPPPPPAPPGPHVPPPPPPPVHGYPPQPVYGYHGHYRHKRRKSFLNELFD